MNETLAPDAAEPPEGWADSPVRAIYRCWGGMTPSTGNSSYWGGSIPWVSSKDVKSWRVDGGTEFVTRKALDETRLTPCRPGTVLVVVRSGVLVHTLPVALTNREVVINQDLKALDSGSDELNEWLAVYLRAHQREILEANRKDGTTVQSIRVEQLLDRAIPVPPLPEQHRIVAKVEALLGEVNAARGKLAKVPVILRRFRQSVLAAACDGRLTEEWRNDRGLTPSVSDDETGSGPIGWTSTTVENVASKQAGSIQSGPFGSHLHHAEFQETGVLAVGIDNVTQGGFRLGRQHRISEDKFRQLAKFQARPLDVLVTVMATVGRCCVFPADADRAIITKHVYRISADPSRIDPFYLCYVLRGDVGVREQIVEQVRGQTRPGINGQILKALQIQLPPLDEQHEIVRRVDALFKVADTIDESVVAASARADKLTRSILAMAFRGELVPTEAELARRDGREYETAEALLERIKAKAGEEQPVAKRGTRRRSKTA